MKLCGYADVHFVLVCADFVLIFFGKVYGGGAEKRGKERDGERNGWSEMEILNKPNPIIIN